MSQVIDTDTARELTREILERIDASEVAAISADLGEKSRAFQERLSPGALPELSIEGYREVLRRVFATRRKAQALLDDCGFENLRDWTGELLWGDAEVGARFQAFVDRLDGQSERVSGDLAGELLHFTRPDACWLWTRWMWDPRTNTGALRLLTSASFDLGGETDGEIYLAVGKATAFLHEVRDAAGLELVGRSVFDTDVFLSCVYTIYTYTVLKMRMTKEFNRVIPKMPEFSRRLLGVNLGQTKKAVEV